MDSFGPFSLEAHKIEQENINLKREIEELRAQLNKKASFYEQKLSEFQITKSKYQELLLKVGEMQKNQESITAAIEKLKQENKELKERNVKLSKNVNSGECCCCCCQSRNSSKQVTELSNKIISIVSQSLGFEAEEIEPSEAPKLAVKLVKRLAKKTTKSTESDEHEEFEKLKRKYHAKTEKCRLLHDECDEYLTKKTYRKARQQSPKRQKPVVEYNYKDEIRNLHMITKDLKENYKELADVDRMKHDY